MGRTWTAVAVAGVLLAAAASAADDSRSLAPAAIESTNGMLFAWPALDAPEYAGADVAPFREMLERWKAGERPRGLPRPPRSAAARYLAADLTFLAVTTGGCAGFAALDAYERALRTAPDFADAARARFMVGATNLALGLFPEAAAAFSRCATRHPALAIEARIAQATALRQGGRAVEARRVLDGAMARARGETLCRARREDAALEATPAALAALARTCPRVLASAGFVREWAETLVASDDVEGARRLLASARPPLGDEEEGRLHLLAGTIAADPDAARLEYEHVLALHVPPALALETEMRLALLETEHDPARRAARLGALARRDAPKALRAILLGEAAEASAEAGRFDQALALLDRSAALGRTRAAEVDIRRGGIIARWIATLAAQGDAAGVAIVYAAYTTEIEEHASGEERLAIGRALGALGLHAAAVRTLRRGVSDTAAAALGATLAEEALAADDLDRARAAAERVLLDPSAPELAVRARAVLARAALRAGNVDAAARIAAGGSDLALRAEVARALLPRADGAARASALLLPLPADGDVPTDALLAAGEAALAAGAWSVAAEIYRRALAVSTDVAGRAEAAAGLARAAHRSGEPAAAARAFATLGGLDDAHDGALFRRVAAAVAPRGSR